jgi:hypothetical protein
MLGALTVGSVLLGIAVSIVALLLRVERSGREHLYHDAVTARLARQFRDDVHAATRLAPAVAGEKGLWRLVLAPDRTVTYRALPQAVEREEAVAGKPVQRESYALPPGRSAHLVAPADTQPPLMTLIVASSPTPGPENHDIRIDAVVGKDRRFTTSPPGSR